MELRGKGTKSSRPTAEQVRRLTQRRLRAFRKKFGRNPLPYESLKFRPDQETPDVVTDEDVRRNLVEAMNATDVDARFIYAFKKTGTFLLDGEEDNWSAEKLAAWEQALAEYDEMLANSQII